MNAYRRFVKLVESIIFSIENNFVNLSTKWSNQRCENILCILTLLVNIFDIMNNICLGPSIKIVTLFSIQVLCF